MICAVKSGKRSYNTMHDLTWGFLLLVYRPSASGYTIPSKVCNFNCLFINYASFIWTDFRFLYETLKGFQNIKNLSYGNATALVQQVWEKARKAWLAMGITCFLASHASVKDVRA